MASQSTIKVLINVKDNASRGIRNVGRNIDQMGRSFDRVKRRSSVALQAVGRSLVTIGKVGLIAALAVGAFGIKAGFAASRNRELGFALDAVARANGISKRATDATVAALEDANIAKDKALQITSLFIQSELKLTDATKLATAAKDLAVISQQDSSEALQTMTTAISIQSPMLLRQFGIVDTLTQVYERYGEAVGVDAEELTVLQKKQAFLNTILRAGKKAAGTYEAAIGAVGKRFRSLTGRILPNFIALIGEVFEPVLVVVIDAITASIKDMTKWLEENKDTIADWGKIAGDITKQVLKVFGKIVNFVINNKEILVGIMVAFALGIGAVVIAFLIAKGVIIGVFAAIVFQVVMFIQMWKQSVAGFKQTVEIYKSLVDKLVPIFEPVFNTIKTIVKDTIDKITEKWREFVKDFETVVKDISGAVDTLVTTFSNFVRNFKEDAGGTLARAVENLATFMVNRIETITNGWVEGFDNMLVSLNAWVDDTAKAIDQWSTDTLLAVDKWVNDTIDAFFDWGVKTLASMEVGWDNMLVSLDEFFNELTDKIIPWLDEMWQNMKTWWSSLGERSLQETLKGFEKERDNWILKVAGFILGALALVLLLLVVELIDLGIRMIRLIFKGISSMDRWSKNKFFAFIKSVISLGGKVGPAIFNFGKSIVTKLIDGIKSAPRAVADAILSLIPNAALRTAIKKVIPGLAHGTDFFQGGPAIVGEQGPELVNLPRGSQVTPLQGGGMGDTFNITLNIGTLIDSDSTRRNFVEKMMQDIEDIATMKGKKANLIT